MPSQRFDRPAGARFAIGSNDDGNAPVFEIWVDAAAGNVQYLGPDGTPGPMGRGSVRVSEDEFWARVAAGEYIPPTEPYVNSLDRVRWTGDLQKWAVEKLVFGRHLEAPADFQRGLCDLKGTMSATYVVTSRGEAERVIDAVLRQFNLCRSGRERVIATQMIDNPPRFRNGFREDKWDLRIADDTWSEIILITPEVDKVKRGVADVADQIECDIAKLKFQGAVSRRLEDARNELNCATRYVRAAVRTQADTGGLILATIPGVRNAAILQCSEVKNREEDFLW